MSKEFNVKDFVKIDYEGDKIFCIVKKITHPEYDTLYLCISEVGIHKDVFSENITKVDIVPDVIKENI
ncbi:hypothetical protein, partial [Lactococcus petauri]|uniref:hypothetical protein n=1 Tax=Lactococcus petauri TaxID=1940789 RepID=UPI0021F20037